MVKPTPPAMNDFQIRLTRRFRKQQQFAAGSSPLSARLCGLMADWLDGSQGSDPLVDWLLQAGATRASFDVPLLLLAGLHRDILAHRVEVSAMAQYFPSVGGTGDIDEHDLARCFREALRNRGTELAGFIRTATVQTNETARGLCWLLPVLFSGWKAVHLVELGASAGLNLVADQRHYQLRGEPGGTVLLDLGSGGPLQFIVANQGALPVPPGTNLPRILSRTGCDIAPFTLATEADEQTLAAFIWGDQVERLTMLRQGIAALHRVNQTTIPVRLFPADLPDDLGRFFEERVAPLVEAPVVLYNTYLTTYLRDKGASLRPQLAVWAEKQSRPVLWLQWETLWQGPQPPGLGWVGWTADLWSGGSHLHWHLAWAHPHGASIHWLPDSAKWAAFWRENRL